MNQKGAVMNKKRDNEKEIRGLSRKLRIFFQICFYIIPAIPILYWLSYNHLSPLMQGGAFNGIAPPFLAVNSRIIAFLGGVPAIIVVLAALNSLKELFGLYEKNIYFQAGNVKQFRLLAKLALWSVLADIVNKTVIILAKTINNPPGEKVLSIGISSDHLKLIVVAGILMIIGRVMDEGRKIYDESQLTV